MSSAFDRVKRVSDELLNVVLAFPLSVNGNHLPLRAEPGRLADFVEWIHYKVCGELAWAGVGGRGRAWACSLYFVVVVVVFVFFDFNSFL